MVLIFNNLPGVAWRGDGRWKKFTDAAKLNLFGKPDLASEQNLRFESFPCGLSTDVAPSDLRRSRFLARLRTR
jgi:hypothetical protein